MNKNSLLITVMGLVAGFIIGFLICNNFFYVRNAGAVPTVNAAGNAPANPAPPDPNGNPGDTVLTPEEIKNVIARADAKPEDFALQKNLAFALYQYSSAQQDVSLLPEVRRLLERAVKLNSSDVDVIVAAGNVNFDIGQNSDPTAFKKARDYYTQALNARPNDANVRTDLGLTYYFDHPSDPAKAVVEYRKSLAIDPKHELTLQNMAFALIALGSIDEAKSTIATLEAVNPANQSLPNMKAQLAQKQNASAN